MGVFYAYTTHLYLSGSRELKRAESVGLSPMYGVFGETLNGVRSLPYYGLIRAYKSLGHHHSSIR